jgi:hypothetical protein
MIYSIVIVDKNVVVVVAVVALRQSFEISTMKEILVVVGRKVKPIKLTVMDNPCPHLSWRF